MFRSVASLACSLVVAACAWPASAPGPAERPLRIAAWNVEHLAEREQSGCRPRTVAEYAQLRAYADSLDADVVAFQEVESAAAAARVFDPAKYVVVIEERAGSQNRLECRGLPGKFLNRQAVGFAIRRGLDYERAADLTALSLGDADLRGGVDVTVRPRGGQPVRLLSVHLKSGCASGRERDACEVLFRQLPVLEGWIDARAGEGTRFAVLGDFNRRLAEAGDPFWAEIDDASRPNADLEMAAGGAGAACDPRYPAFIDHVVLDRRAAADLVRFEERGFGGGAKLSDHCAVVGELRP